jgi:hypothetical protein
MNLYAAADDMIEVGSRELSHCFGLGIPTTYENGKSGEKVLKFAKSPAAVIEADMSAAFEQDTFHVDGIEDYLPGSPERIELLKNYYASEELKAEPRSASVITDDEFAAELIEAVINFGHDAKQTPLVVWLREELKESHK